MKNQNYFQPSCSHPFRRTLKLKSAIMIVDIARGILRTNLSSSTFFPWVFEETEKRKWLTCPMKEFQKTDSFYENKYASICEMNLRCKSQIPK